MTSTPGYYPRHWFDQRNPAGPLLRFSCPAATGTTALELRRSWDFGTTWDAAITVVASLPAQRSDARGDGQTIVLCYHDAAGAIVTLLSHDDGATWS